MPLYRMNQAISLAVAEEMTRDDDVIILGEDIAVAEGTFKTSVGLLQQFGPTRVRDTPISEMGFLGAAVGASVTGLRPVVEIMFMEFLGVALDQLVTEAALMRYLSDGEFRSALTVRASVGAGSGLGCQHSQTLEHWVFGTPGLKVAVASGPRTAYGLVKAAIRDDDPVMLLEPRILYGRREDFEPDGDPLPLGVAETVTSGSDVTLVCLGHTVSIGREAEQRADWNADVIDLLTLQPWDRDLVRDSVARTGRLVTVEASPETGGWGSTVVADVAAHCQSVMKAPPLRITAPDVPVPSPAELEARFVPSVDYVTTMVDSLLKTGELPPPWWEGLA